MKSHADQKSYVRIPDMKKGDWVLLRQKKQNKFSTPYEVKPYVVDEVKGSRITASNSLHQVTRHVNLFKKIPRVESDELWEATGEESVLSRIAGATLTPRRPETIPEVEGPAPQPEDRPAPAEARQQPAHSSGEAEDAGYTTAQHESTE